MQAVTCRGCNMRAAMCELQHAGCDTSHTKEMATCPCCGCLQVLAVSAHKSLQRLSHKTEAAVCPLSACESFCSPTGAIQFRQLAYRQA